MKTYINKFKTFAAWVVSWFPTPLPNSVKTHEDWSGSILKIGGYPDNDSFRNTVATMLLHLNTDTHFKSKQYFIRSIRRAIVNEVAWGVTAMIKGKMKNEKTVEGIDSKVV